MLLCFDIGNSHIHGGVFDGDRLCGQFRKSTNPLATSDELGVFFAAVLREQGIDPRGIRRTALCSVVPAVLYSMRSACIKYFQGEPFVLQAGVKTGLRIRYRNPHEVSADRIANAISATQLHPARDLAVVDFGTATTIDTPRHWRIPSPSRAIPVPPRLAPLLALSPQIANHAVSKLSCSAVSRLDFDNESISPICTTCGCRQPDIELSWEVSPGASASRPPGTGGFLPLQAFDDEKFGRIAEIGAPQNKIVAFSWPEARSTSQTVANIWAWAIGERGGIPEGAPFKVPAKRFQP